MFKEKVYCEECKYFEGVFAGIYLDGDGSEDEPYRCIYPKNIKSKTTWYNRTIERRQKRSAYKINKRNRCRWFKIKQEGNNMPEEKEKVTTEVLIREFKAVLHDSIRSVSQYSAEKKLEYIKILLDGLVQLSDLHRNESE